MLDQDDNCLQWVLNKKIVASNTLVLELEWARTTWSVGGLLLQVESWALTGGPQGDGGVGRVAGGFGLRSNCRVSTTASLVLVIAVL